ncbi:tRNA (5-methylaminomethyl-2-thiouridylate)-methyltransferase [Neorickettsia helminthoeca str. Oregon]|uniref:tRNA-specific 2-thiouridylase MnmA n=1 Tax=Neorickettsia helminthoeca str. Oregon TaxID=1286528 RepID=X5GWF0_9RICK|nr:tRNA 2-thiouridine(34) synthase MnmA [Neorickettsia helminthoeca]AHX11387.1 tRNA (5-methylaminomethyl-2-thiouridylate)-methyltransferase [Neorickettsia helminthoeca str. Oregon]
MLDFMEIAPGKLPRDTKVMVAMSGGIDSSTVAAYLHQLGYQVIGVTLQLYSSNEVSQTRKKTCCAGSDIFDAKSVAAQFGFLHYVINMEDTFKKEVIEDFAESYLKGETPIPCVKCNQTVKFRDLLKIAKSLNVDALATGHYVRRVIAKNSIELHKGVDSLKDQSYFLFNTTKEQLKFLRFPLGNLKKSETRDLARELGITISEKSESQDICFVKSRSYADIVEKFKPGSQRAGKIVDLQGKVLGTHSGILHYTVGQRHGLNISASEPLYVIKIEDVTNTIAVGPRSALKRDSLYIRQLNWLDNQELIPAMEVEVKLRSGSEVVKASLFPQEERLKITLHEEPKCAIAPGQACVMYRGTKVLGGGWIMK